MKIYSNLPQDVVNKISKMVRVSVTSSVNDADIFVYMCNENAEKMPNIIKPEFTMLIGEMNNEPIMSYIEKATEKGVDEENIILIPKEQEVSIEKISEKITKLKNNASSLYRQGNGFIDSSNKYSMPATKSSKQIGIISYKGGVGKTTLATALAFYFSSCGETVGIVDLGKPPTATYYMGKPPLANNEDCFFAKTMRGDIIIPKSQNNIKGLIDRLSHHYDRLIFDFHASGGNNNFLSVNATKILIVDYDLRTLEITKENLKTPIDDYILLANRIPRIFSGTYSLVIADILNKPPAIEVLTDSSGCQAVLKDYTPVNDDGGSEILAQKVGELASLINRREESYV